MKKAFAEDFDHYRNTLSKNTFFKTAFCSAPVSRTSLDDWFYKIRDYAIFNRSLVILN